MNSKKAYILAFQKATNYGAVLQIYALKTTLEKLDLTVEVIDYIPKWMQVTLKNQPSLKSFLKRKIMNLTFKSFFKKLKLTQNSYYDNKSLTHDLNTGDFYFVGSDQVWNPKIMQNDSTYFLDFVPKNAKKIGYAVSMGNQVISDKFMTKVLPLIKDFDFISAREDFVTNFIHNYDKNIQIPIVLDPTLLLNASDYETLKDKTKFRSKYIAVYAAMHDENLYDYARYLKEKTGLPIINLGYHFNGADRQEYIKGPGNWLNRIEQSNYFITNSFHGTVFSILYKKEFFVVPNQNQLGLNARFIELLESLKLNSRLIHSKHEIDTLLHSKLVFENAYLLLKERKKQSLKYIKETIEND